MKHFMVLFLVFSSLNCISQPSYVKLFSIQTDADNISADAIGNIYIVKGSEVVKYNEKGVLCCSFSNQKYGAVTSIDTRDPLRILLFYKPFGKVILLDNNLTEQTTIDLRSLDITDPLLVCSSEIQGMWVYDNATARLYKFNTRLQAVSLSNDLHQDVMHNITPVMMSESDYWLVVLEKNNLLVFDKMGNYFKSFQMDIMHGGQLIHDDWIYSNDQKVKRLNIRNGVTTEVILPFPTMNSNILLSPQRLMRLSEKTLDVYTY